MRKLLPSSAVLTLAVVLAGCEANATAPIDSERPFYGSGYASPQLVHIYSATQLNSNLQNTSETTWSLLLRHSEEPTLGTTSFSVKISLPDGTLVDSQSLGTHTYNGPVGGWSTLTVAIDACLPRHLTGYTYRFTWHDANGRRLDDINAWAGHGRYFELCGN